MKNILFQCLAFYFLVSSRLFSQIDTSQSIFEFLPAGIHFLPLKGSNQEAKMGVLYYLETANLKVDIGNSVDLVKIRFPGNTSFLTFGIEFMAYAYSTSYKGNRLQIDAVDGLFGGNTCFSSGAGKDRFITRLRIIHNSAHFVDGHWDASLKSWIGNQEPIPFTRDFGELMFAYEWNRNAYALKIYGGPSYSTLVRPSVIKKYSFSSGFEYALLNPFGLIWGKDENIFAAYYFNIAGTPEYQGNHNILLGVKLGTWDEKGVVFYFNYYSGSNMFSEYYKDRITRPGIGFMVDFY